MKIWNDLLKDRGGKYSLAKCILSAGFVVASVVLIKMAILHEPELGMAFLEYIAFISGHANMSKFLDKRKDDNFPGK